MAAKAKCIGWACSMVPEEIVYAAGLYSKRLYNLKSNEVGFSRSELPTNFCSLVRTYEDALNHTENKDFDGFIFTTACNATNFLYDSLKHSKKLDFLFMLDIPRKQNDQGVIFYKEQLLKLANALQHSFEVHIDRESLIEAIELFNKIRAQMKIFKKARLSGQISGKEYFDIVRLLDVPDKKKALQEIENKRETLKANDSLQDKRKKILVLGSPLLNEEILTSIESQSALVFMDDLCNMDTYLGEPVDISGDLYANLASSYLNNRMCSRMETKDTRNLQIKSILEQHKPHGVIYNLSKFRVTDCYESVMLKEDVFKQNNIPFLVLENDNSINMNSSVKLRVDSFLEML